MHASHDPSETPSRLASTTIKPAPESANPSAMAAAAPTGPKRGTHHKLAARLTPRAAANMAVSSPGQPAPRATAVAGPTSVAKAKLTASARATETEGACPGPSHKVNSAGATSQRPAISAPAREKTQRQAQP